MNDHPILGLIVAAWGTAILANYFLGTSPSGDPAYQSGVSIAALFGAVMVFLGSRELYRWNKGRD